MFDKNTIKIGDSLKIQFGLIRILIYIYKEWREVWNCLSKSSGMGKAGENSI